MSISSSCDSVSRDPIQGYNPGPPITKLADGTLVQMEPPGIQRQAVYDALSDDDEYEASVLPTSFEDKYRSNSKSKVPLPSPWTASTLNVPKSYLDQRGNVSGFRFNRNQRFQPLAVTPYRNGTTCNP